MNNNVLAFDLGGSSGRAIIASLNNDCIQLKEINRFSYPPFKDKDGHLRWDFNLIMSHIYKSLQLAKPYNITSIGIDTWGVDYGLIDKNGQLIDNPFHYRDARTELAEAQVYEIISKQELYKASGIQPMRINTINQLYWDKTHNLDQKAMRFAFISDLIAYQLTGQLFAELSIASTSGLLCQDKKDWNWELIDLLGLQRSLFPPIISSGQKYGDLLPSLCDSLDIPSVSVTAVCQHDTASAIICSGNDNSVAYISCGTWALIGVLLDKVNTSNMQFTNECGWNGKITYLNNTTGMWIVQEIRRNLIESGSNMSFCELDDLAEISTFDGIINPNDKAFEEPCDMTNTITQYLSSTNQQPPKSIGDIVRCVYLSQALTYDYNIKQLELTIGKNIDTIFIFGGGSNSKLLAQITADITNKKVLRGIKEATALGNVAVQFMSTTDYDMQEIQDIISRCNNVETHNPAKQYDKGIYSAYLSLVD